uniref:Uncharacterized protein n=1 Tax=Pyrodinium bahamense TaxID=73915 RepID=A0A7S0A6W0_9DINO|mmetsp:Transcript_25459/g.69991  ORF Transcript_25459/g.69991 Transcript_25459/m.69991 type:complete len:378 (+) Transcript_25459:47-1180(+)
MFRSGLEQKCPGLKLACVPHLGHFNDGLDYKLARTLAAVRFMKDPHEKIPVEGFDLLMRRDNVMDIEVYLALYDMQDLRDWLYKTGRSYFVNLLFHAWVFPQLAYRGEAETLVEAAIFEGSGVFAVTDSPEGVTRSLRSFSQRVWVRDKVYMCMGPDSVRCRVDRHRLVCTVWSLCVPAGEERAVVTKHVLLNETRTHISRELGVACTELSDASVGNVLQHLQRLLQAVQNASHRLSKLMARCEGAFEGIFLDGGGNGQTRHQGATEPTEVWEEQLALLDRSVNDGITSAERPAPLLSELIRLRVYEELGRRRRKGKIPFDDQETIDMGAKAFITPSGSTGSERAQVVHIALIECIHDLERFAESNAEMLAVEGVTL